MLQQTDPQPADDSESAFCPSCQTIKPRIAFCVEKKQRMPYGRRLHLWRGQYEHCAECVTGRQARCPACQLEQLLIKFHYMGRKYASARTFVYSRSEYCHRCYCWADRSREKYGGTRDLYLKTLAAQGGVCALCSAGPAVKLHVDHSHATKKFRAILCRSCNLGIGHFRDNPALLRLAALYVEQHGG